MNSALSQHPVRPSSPQVTSNEELEQQDNPGVEIEDVAQCRCTACEGVIPFQNIVTSMNKRSGVRTIHTYCDHCKRLCVIQRVLRFGDWVTRSIVAIDNVIAKKMFLRQIAERRNEIQQRLTQRQRKEARRIDRAFATRLEEDQTEPGRDFTE